MTLFELPGEPTRFFLQADEVCPFRPHCVGPLVDRREFSAYFNQLTCVGEGLELRYFASKAFSGLIVNLQVYRDTRHARPGFVKCRLPPREHRRLGLDVRPAFERVAQGTPAGLEFQTFRPRCV